MKTKTEEHELKKITARFSIIQYYIPQTLHINDQIFKDTASLLIYTD
jgi:hypothetical protein